MRGPIAEIERARASEVIFYREPELAAGVYTMETVVHDAPSGKASVRFSTLDVPRHDPARLRISSVIIVKRADTVPEQDRRPDNPLMVNGVALSPNLGDPVSKAAKEVGFYFAVYPAPGTSNVQVMIQLVQNGAMVAQVPMLASSADSSGRIPQLGRLPIDKLPSGTYDLRVVVKQGDEQVTQSTLLRVVD